MTDTHLFLDSNNPENLKHAQEWISRKLKRPNSLMEVRFDGEICYNGEALTVRIWCELERGVGLEDASLRALRTKFDQMIEVAYAEGLGSLYDLAKWMSTNFDSATVELMDRSTRIGVVYYPEWP